MQLGGLQGWEWVIIVFVILLLFGGRKIPDLARSLGRAMGEFRRGRDEIERELREGAEKGAAQPKAPESAVVKAARDLGISTEGKSEEQLKKEIEERMKAAS